MNSHQRKKEGLLPRKPAYICACGAIIFRRGSNWGESHLRFPANRMRPEYECIARTIKSFGYLLPSHTCLPI